MVQPLYQSQDRITTFFYQPRISLTGGDLTYSLGVGYRKILHSNLILGVNLFGDYQDLHEHGRLGLGFEALGEILEARLNSYFGITTKRIVENSPSSTTYERVTDGLDFEVGAPLPYLPWLKIYTSGFWYDFDKFNDKYGWKTRLTVKLNDTFTLEVYTWDDNKGEQEYGGKLECRIPFEAIPDFREIFVLSKEPFPREDIRKKVLIPVERNFDIVVEKWIETASMTIEIGRGN